MKTHIAILICIFLTSGCGIIPKDVEYFQATVQPLPEYGEGADEVLRQTAQRAAEKSAQTYTDVITIAAPPDIIGVAKEASDASQAVSSHLGPPEAASDKTTEALVALLERERARHEEEIRDYQRRLYEKDLVGKKVEGSGAIQLGYTTNLLLVGGGLLVAFIILRAIAAVNAPVRIGMNAVSGGAKVVKRAVGELVEGGQAFKTRIKATAMDEQLKAEVLEIFRSAQEGKQSRDTQMMVKGLKG